MHFQLRTTEETEEMTIIVSPSSFIQQNNSRLQCYCTGLDGCSQNTVKLDKADSLDSGCGSAGSTPEMLLH